VALSYAAVLLARARAANTIIAGSLPFGSVEEQEQKGLGQPCHQDVAGAAAGDQDEKDLVSLWRVGLFLQTMANCCSACFCPWRSHWMPRLTHLSSQYVPPIARITLISHLSTPPSMYCQNCQYCQNVLPELHMVCIILLEYQASPGKAYSVVCKWVTLQSIGQPKIQTYSSSARIIFRNSSNLLSKHAHIPELTGTLAGWHYQWSRPVVSAKV